MSKRHSIRIIDGRHLTAADKRNIIDGIGWLRGVAEEALRENPGKRFPYAETGFRRSGSPKTYRLDPSPDNPTIYRVEIIETYRTAFDQTRKQTYRLTIQIDGVEPLPGREQQAAS